MKALVLGSSGLIGSHIIKRLKAEGYWVRGVDIRYPEFHKEESDEFVLGDLRNPQFVESVLRLDYNDELSEIHSGYNFLQPPFTIQKSFDEVYQLAADMGGALYIFTGDNDADIMHNSGLININVAAHAQISGVKKLFYSSSACIYPKEIQQNTDHKGLKESDAWPANPDSNYGIEKIFSERLYLAYAKNYGLNIRIARFHNVYGENSPFDNIRAKAPAAICRKVIQCNKYSQRGNNIEVLGDGQQTRSFLYIDDCIDAVRLLMESDFKEPINIGSEEMVSINQLAQMAIDISGKQITIKNVLSNALGVRGRNSDNTLIEKTLNWKPKYSLQEGLTKTFHWIKTQYEKN